MLHHKPLFKEIFALAVIVATLHMLALKLYLYWTTDWFDIPMHFLGGLLVGLVVIFICYVSGYVRMPTMHRGVMIAVILGGVLLVGVAWEVWEIFVGFTDMATDQVDTILDLIMDTIGGIVAIVYTKSLLWNNKTS